MAKHSGRKKKLGGEKLGESISRRTTVGESAGAYDKDTAVFILMSHELKDEGNRLFQNRDYEGAMLKYDKAIKLLPRSHIDVSYLRSNMAACYMQLGISEYPRAINECNLALEVTPKYSKALLKRARCYEALNKLDLALRDVRTVLKMEPNNLMAIEVSERLKQRTGTQYTRENEVPTDLVPLPECCEPPNLPLERATKGNTRKKKSHDVLVKEIFTKVEESNEDAKGRVAEEIQRKSEGNKVTLDVSVTKTELEMEPKKAEDLLVVEQEEISNGTEEEQRRTVKLVLGEDIRWAQVPFNCSLLTLRKVIADRFPSSKAVLVKYRDQEGDLVTITSTEELRLAEGSVEHGYVKLYVIEVNQDQDPFFERIREHELHNNLEIRIITGNGHLTERKEVQSKPACINDWIIQFALLFKNYVGFDVDSYLDLHDNAMKFYSDAMEETVTSDEAQDLFCAAGERFQELAALALFNWGNVHMVRARKKAYFTDDPSQGSVLNQVMLAYDWAQAEFSEAGKRYEEALKIKPNFCEVVLALGQQQFELAKLSWYHAMASDVDLESWPSTETLHLYNKAEDNMEKGMQMWEEVGEMQVNELSNQNKIGSVLQKLKLDMVLKPLSKDEVTEKVAKIRAQILVLWGTILYERSIMEFKLGLPVWQECLEVAVEKFEVAGASPTDIAVMVKNHCSNNGASEGLGFNIDEIVQAWNEMHEAKKWQNSVNSMRLEPLLRRRVSKLYHSFENA